MTTTKSVNTFFEELWDAVELDYTLKPGDHDESDYFDGLAKRVVDLPPVGMWMRFIDVLGRKGMVLVGKEGNTVLFQHTIPETDTGLIIGQDWTGQNTGPIVTVERFEEVVKNYSMAQAESVKAQTKLKYTKKIRDMATSTVTIVVVGFVVGLVIGGVAVAAKSR